MPKKLNTDSILNELEGASAFFQRPVAAENPTPSQSSRAKTPETKTASAHPSGGANAQPNPGAIGEANGYPNARPNGVPTGSRQTFDTSLQEEIEQAALIPPKRTTTRMSFEAYNDQKVSIARLQKLYKEKTGRELAASRIIREALDSFLEVTLKKLEKE